ncbi:MAG: hypothetical protein AAF228_12755 [Pseudomonadota bacterium]
MTPSFRPLENIPLFFVSSVNDIMLNMSGDVLASFNISYALILKWNISIVCLMHHVVMAKNSIIETAT